MDSNLQPYHLLRIDDLTYSFTTDNGIEYKCTFLSFAEYFVQYPAIADKVFSFNLEIASKLSKQKGVDNRIAATVINIVGDFLMSKINAVVYVCDPSDGKAHVRSRKFKSWFDYFEHSSHQIIQVNADFEAGGITLYTALLVHRKNKLKKQLLEAYLDLTDYDEDEK
jgi:hypothetical protein